MDKRPANCRFRLQEEGKNYPRSSCQACGVSVFNGLGNTCTYVKQELLPIETEGVSITETDMFLTLFIHWMERDRGTFRQDNTIDQLLIMAKELQEKLCGTSSKSSTE